jgi:hypothetical protein
MTNLPHEIIVEISPDGKITSEVKGVTGKSCTALSAWLDDLGKVEVDRHTADYHKPDKVMTTGYRKAGG